MKILMVAHFCDGVNENTNNRFNYIYRLMKENNYDVSLITSDYSHRNKNVRLSSTDSNIIYLHEPPYKKNICLKRFYSHYIFGKELSKYLKNIEKPKVIYCSVPSLDAGYTVAKYANKNNIPLIIDIQDLWPEAFQMVFNFPIISNLIFYPLKRRARYIYSKANYIIAVSETYKKLGLKFNKDKTKGLSVFLGTDLKKLDFALNEITMPDFKKNDEEIWIGYLGTLGSSYDLDTVLKAVKKVQITKKNVKLIVLGDGPLEGKFKQHARDLNVNSIFLGRKEYLDAMYILSKCDIAVNPLVKGAAQSIINKVGDYAALGLPVINSLENKEYINLLEQYNAGINIKCENTTEMYNAMMKLITNEDLRKKMGKQSRKFAEALFDRNVTYLEIVKIINKFL